MTKEVRVSQEELHTLIKEKVAKAGLKKHTLRKLRLI